MEKINNEVVDVVATEEPAVQPDGNLIEVIIGIPANSAMMRVSVLTVNENGQAEEKTGEFNFEQLLQSRAKYLQLLGRSESTGTDIESGTNGSNEQSVEPSEEEGEATKE